MYTWCITLLKNVVFILFNKTYKIDIINITANFVYHCIRIFNFLHYYGTLHSSEIFCGSMSLIQLVTVSNKSGDKSIGNKLSLQFGFLTS